MAARVGATTEQQRQQADSRDQPGRLDVESAANCMELLPSPLCGGSSYISTLTLRQRGGGCQPGHSNYPTSKIYLLSKTANRLLVLAAPRALRLFAGVRYGFTCVNSNPEVRYTDQPLVAHVAQKLISQEYPASLVFQPHMHGIC